MKSFQEFTEQKMAENVAMLLYATDTNVEDFCEMVLVLAQNDKLDEVSLNELGWRNMLGGASNVASGVAGLGGLGRWAGRGIGNTIGRGASAIGNAASSVGRGIGNAASSMGRGIGNAASAVGQGIGNTATSARDMVAQRYNSAKQALGQGASAVGNAANTAWDKTGGAAARGIGSAANAAGQAGSNMMQSAGQHFAQASQGEQLRQATNAVGALQKQLSAMGYDQNWLGTALSPLLDAIKNDAASNSSTLGHKIGSNMSASPAARSAI